MYFNLTKSAAEVNALLVDAYDEVASSNKRSHEQFHKFKNCKFDLKDEDAQETLLKFIGTE